MIQLAGTLFMKRLVISLYLVQILTYFALFVVRYNLLSIKMNEH